MGIQSASPSTFWYWAYSLKIYPISYLTKQRLWRHEEIEQYHAPDIVMSNRTHLQQAATIVLDF